ncbi:hypothetical protein A4X20_24530 [Mycolicibacterium iranicum]|uniref:Rad50/SbcC-type AAA domain-containing protein n=1 Tax=Mycolicibacterium iranicum TaxID=912594 RepID=A0A178LRH4_MYCIR|nr:hypothetical protein A4X20_24530 [Mycolicibacterium iranicum]
MIGPRGVGKTTLLELIGHALGTGRANLDSEQQQDRRVRTLLADGEVVLDIEDEETSYRLIVDAEGGGRRPQSSGRALMLGQNELEAIASDRASRLRLIDFRSRAIDEPELDYDEIEDLTRQLYSLRQQIEALEESTRTRAVLEDDLRALEAEEAARMEAASASMTVRRDTLRSLEDQLLAVQTQSSQAEAATELLVELQTSHRSLTSAAARARELSLAPADEQLVRPHLLRVEAAISTIGGELARATEQLTETQRQRSQRALEIRTAAEPLRSELDAAERGLGELTARIRRVRTELERLGADEARLYELHTRRKSFFTRREDLLDEAELVKERLYRSRLEVADSVSQNLTSRVTVQIEHLSDSLEFRDFLTNSLRKSGLRYASVVDALSKNLLPRQLLIMIENFDVDAAAQLTEIPPDRLARAFEHLDDPEILAELSTTHLEDVADFLLMDGSSLKSVELLSTGQKCAVTLPILLTEHTRLLILDQPEDHLDNAFLVDSIVVGLNRRSDANAQTLIATHNANIPVLGSASNVISLRSDGKKGYLSDSGPYNNSNIVVTITKLMEGGEEAFRRRAQFYQRYGLVE